MEREREERGTAVTQSERGRVRPETVEPHPPSGKLGQFIMSLGDAEHSLVELTNFCKQGLFPVKLCHQIAQVFFPTLCVWLNVVQVARTEDNVGQEEQKSSNEVKEKMEKILG